MSEIKKKWVEALRSGDYKQGKTCLKQIDFDGETRHCCLGVLAEICEVPNEILGGSLYTFNFPRSDKYMFFRSTALLDKNFEMKHFIYGYSNIRTLMRMNDSGDYTFEDIADYIEKHVPMMD